MSSPSWYAEVPARPPPARPAPSGGAWKKPCTARDAQTGLRCRLLEHPGHPHASERGPFELAAAPGQVTFEKVEGLVAVATSRPEYVLETASGAGGKGTSFAALRPKAAARKSAKARERYRQELAAAAQEGADAAP